MNNIPSSFEKSMQNAPYTKNHKKTKTYVWLCYVRTQIQGYGYIYTFTVDRPSIPLLKNEYQPSVCDWKWKRAFHLCIWKKFSANIHNILKKYWNKMSRKTFKKMMVEKWAKKTTLYICCSAQFFPL